MDVEENRASVDNSKTDSQMDLPKATKTNKNVKKETHFCRWCCSHLSVDARVCQTCGRHQKPLWNYFSPGLLFVSTCISIIMVGISVVNVSLTKRNLNLAEQERIKAEEALTIAQSASKEALNAKDIALAAQSLLDDLSLMADVNNAAISAPHDIHALKKLWNISNGKNDRAKVLAEKQLGLIRKQLRADYEMVTSDYWGFKEKQDAQYFGFNEMVGWKRAEYIANYMKVPDDRRVVYVIQYLSDDSENEDEKLSFCYSALQLESRPEVIYAICTFIDVQAKLNKDYLIETDYYITWLKERNS
jgi:hypothetical protein